MTNRTAQGRQVLATLSRLGILEAYGVTDINNDEEVGRFLEQVSADIEEFQTYVEQGE